MEKPFEYFAIHNQTGEIRYFNNMMFKPYQCDARLKASEMEIQLRGILTGLNFRK